MSDDREPALVRARRLFDLDELERAGCRLIEAIKAVDASRHEGSLEALHEMALARQEYDRTIAEFHADSPHTIVAMTQYIRELRSGLADALYWLKLGFASQDDRASEMAKEREELSTLLAKEIELP